MATKVKKGKTKAKATKPQRTNGDLTGNEHKLLAALKGTSAGGRMLTRSQLSEKTGIKKGFSKLLGAPTTDNVEGLEGRDLVKHAKVEDQRELGYYITAKGMAALAKPAKAKQQPSA